MVEASLVDAALKRLDMSLGALEAAVERRLEHERSVLGLEDELSRTGEDRSRLAQDLDQERARSGRLEETNREVSRRLVAAMETIRSVLEANGG
ncbi:MULTISPECIES: DUF4164 domain-containing protein [Hyphomicrobiales]|jgi:hypothetical protein|uniref:Tropomyosin n=2 Tax=Prosthecodimorpha TaxID=2981530 RepID=A0A0P6VZL3_9HYPH|nr:MULTISPECIES: DUF4164 domain-containing protein [Hyphomicrobiales]KPL52179.1 hypothetical protein ABB55_08005 [Prosthecomicrobium hirschii]MBT9288809.1 DUF4164 domain-containing protein [Prosthecodimorpha staleyi]MCW1843431.1 DUF4164 domain-containing protein [Prosthecomicrobium hirschii]TPQ45344.1 DUF4164 domain-containing protein [Prosthecomicrobium hirschii]